MIMTDTDFMYFVLVIEAVSEIKLIALISELSNTLSINRLKAPIKMYPERFISADKLKAGSPDVDSNIYGVEAFEEAGKEMFGEWGCVPLIAFGKAQTSAAFKLLARAKDLDFDMPISTPEPAK